MLKMTLSILLLCLTGLPAVVLGRALPGDPSLLEAAGTTPVAATQEKLLFSYTIRPGDTLWDIAKWVLKDPFQWPEMLKYNYIENPDLIYPGDRLIVPSPEVLERVRQARDVAEIEEIRREAEIGAKILELPPPEEGAPMAITPLAEDLVRVPLVEPETGTSAASDLKISGRKTMSFQYREYRGGVSPYYFSSGYTRQESLDLSFSGQIMNAIKVEGKFYQSDQSLENKYSLKLATENLELFLGDFTAELPDTEFLLRDRNLSGGRFTADFTSWGGVALAGAAKGIARYERFYGNRTQGPYYLTQAPVVFGSEQVLLNKTVLTKGSDYTLDYLSGQLTFLHHVVDDISLIEVVYESRQTVYPRSLYAGRMWGKPADWLRIGVAAVREEDPKSAGIAQLDSGNTLTPIGHWVLGSDVLAEVPGFGSLSGELAHSRLRSNRLEDSTVVGQAARAALTGSLGPVGLTGYYRRTTPDFQMVGGSEQGSDYLNYGGKLDVKTGGATATAGEYDYKETLLAGIRETIEQAMGRAGLSFRGWPSAGYEYFQLSERNDAPVPERLDHLTRRHTGLLEINRDYFDVGLRGEYERREGQLATRPSALTRRLALSAAAKNIRWMSLSTSAEHQVVTETGTSLSAEADYRVTQAAVNGSVTPSDRYAFTADNRWVWDEQYGSTQTLDTKLNVRPIDSVRLDANYTWETLQTLISSETKPVYTQTASGQLEITPWTPLSFRLAPSLRWTSLAESGSTLNKTRADLATCKWAMLPQLSHELEGRRDLYVLADSTDPGLRIQTEQENRKAAYAFKAAISQSLAGDATASYEQYHKNNYNLTSSGYDRILGRHRTFSLGLRSSLREVWRLDGTYRLDLRNQDGSSPASVTRTAYPISETGQTTAEYDLLNSYGTLHTRQENASAKLTYQWSEMLSAYAEGVYDRNEDLSGREPVIHTAAPGLGCVLRWQQLRAEAGVKWAKSWGAVATHQETYNLTLNYNPLDLFSLSLRGQHSMARDPFSVSTEVDLTSSIQF